MILGTLETRNFSFTVIANSKDGAMNALEKSWHEHTGGSDYYYSWDFLKDDVSLLDIELNTVIKR
jgi:hypothetical protein